MFECDVFKLAMKNYGFLVLDWDLELIYHPDNHQE